MKHACVLLALTVGACAIPATDHSERPPNIVVVLLDDLGYSDYGFMGSEIQTPHIDALAEAGVAYTQFYVHPRCSPTRASLLTGLSPHEAGLAFLAMPDTFPSIPGPYQGHLHEDATTLADALQARGYRTMMSGKWHVGEAAVHWPQRHGFDDYFGLISGASSYYELIRSQRLTRTMVDGDQPYEPPSSGFFMTDAFTDRALQFLDQQHAQRPGQPFFLYLAYTAPHWPLHAKQDDIDAYDGAYDAGPEATSADRLAAQAGLKIAGSNSPAQVAGEVMPADYMQAHAAMVTAADRGVGQLVGALRRADQLDNTILLVFSDNGASTEDVTSRGLHQEGTRVGQRGSYLSFGPAWASVAGTPLRGHKGGTFEGGIRTPLVVHWPERIPAKGFDTDAVIHVEELFATLLAATGSPCSDCLDSRLPTWLSEQRQDPGVLYWEHLGWRAVRDGAWKAVYPPQEARWMLFNLTEDPAEQHDLADRYPQRVENMSAGWQAWADKVGVSPELLQRIVRGMNR